MSQTAYTETISAGRAGQRANMEPVDYISRTVETVAGVTFGAIVQQGARDNGCKGDLTGMTAQTFLGVVVRERGGRPEFPNGYAQYDTARLALKGVHWVPVGMAVTPAGVPTVTLATGVIGVTAVGAGVVAIPGARFEGTTSGAGLVQLRLS